jgi:hypothetical protein
VEVEVETSVPLPPSSTNMTRVLPSSTCATCLPWQHPATYPALATMYFGIVHMCTSSARLKALKYEASKVNNKQEIQFCDYLPSVEGF